MFFPCCSLKQVSSRWLAQAHGAEERNGVSGCAWRQHTAWGCCRVRQAHRDVAGVTWQTVWHLEEATGAQGSLLQGRCRGVWLNSEFLCTSERFGKLKQPACSLASCGREQAHPENCSPVCGDSPWLVCPWEALGPCCADSKASHPSCARSHNTALRPEQIFHTASIQLPPRLPQEGRRVLGERTGCPQVIALG